ncbi:13559_t:CDS:2 [Funneliformis geosporum]|uniref:13559_t:CDS:1 n=1 Tax=Funneliformis geosporum TaxID=1117311 RepID=A0A9W4WL92_9GLOM|nr:13559_t:CDS:2 [Funneliformis geosporum]
MEKAFSELEGFTEQKEDIRSLFLTKKYFKDQNIKFRESGKILCFVGPAGVGKTKFAKVIAKAMGRPFFKINVAGESDPQIIIVEKMGESPIKGSPKDALLHVLDPEQNQEFRDKFLNIELDISRITFILTANSLDGLSEPLKNRLKIVKLKGYNEMEKLSIGKLEIENVFRETYGNAKRDLFEMNDDTLRVLIGKVKEEGVRQLKKEIENIISHFFGQLALRHEKGEPENKIVIDENKVNQIVSDPKKKDKDEENENAESERRIRELENEIRELRDKTNYSGKNLDNNNSKSNSVGLP